MFIFLTIVIIMTIIEQTISPWEKIEMYCRNCGREIDDRAVICPHCGVPVETEKAKPGTPGLCIAGFVISLFSIWLGVFLCIPSIVLSTMGNRWARENGFHSGLGTAGLVIGIITTVFWGLFFLAIFIASASA